VIGVVVVVMKLLCARKRQRASSEPSDGPCGREWDCGTRDGSDTAIHARPGTPMTGNLSLFVTITTSAVQMPSQQKGNSWHIGDELATTAERTKNANQNRQTPRTSLAR
jgi:hypothetical protein